MAWHGMAWHGMAWHGMAWHGCGVLWRGVVWCGMARYGMVWYGMAWYGMVQPACKKAYQSHCIYMRNSQQYADLVVTEFATGSLVSLGQSCILCANHILTKTTFTQGNQLIYVNYKFAHRFTPACNLLQICN